MDIVKEQLEITEKNAENYLWHTFWLLIRKADRIAVGSAVFKDTPNGHGEVELGYGLRKAFEHNGYIQPLRITRKKPNNAQLQEHLPGFFELH